MSDSENVFESTMVDEEEEEEEDTDRKLGEEEAMRRKTECLEES